MLVVERHLIDGTPEIIRLCTQSKELYNKCNFLMRKAWFGDERLPDLNILVQETQGLDCFKNLHNTKTAKQTVRKVLTDWSNFKAALRAWKKDPTKFRKMPMPPYYKDKLAQVIFYNETIKKKPLKAGIITPTNNLFSVKCNKDFKQVVVKRYFQIENYFHHASKFIVDLCVKHGIGRIIIGKNDGWKQEVKMRKPQKQNFQCIPFYRFIEKVKYKATLASIVVEFTEEAYTSKASFP